jgi:DUF1680 family protein
MDQAILVDTIHSPYARLCPVPLSAVHMEEGFWARWMVKNREATLPSQYRLLESTGRLSNFRRAAGHPEIPFQGYYYNDSDVYKWLEGASWALLGEPDARLKEMVDSVIDLIAAAQSEDGYLDTYFTHERESLRWTNVKDLHELYCAGHLIQAAIAHHRVTGEEKLFAIAQRLADHIWRTFGPQGRRMPSGHPEIEIALVELYRETGEERYLELAQRFLDARGHGLIGGGEYLIDRTPFRDLQRLEGHAVRALYLCSGATDIYLETGEESLRSALERLWNNMTQGQVYVTGGIGSRFEGEAFGGEYELPNQRAYAETCAGIANVLWNWRMLHIQGEPRYADLLEVALYNAALAGISQEGTSYFYVNPLSDEGLQRRQDWYECACCPPNLARVLATIPAYLYSTSSEGFWIHQYASNQATLHLPDGDSVTLKQRTNYPWDGEVEIEIVEARGKGETSLFLRIPGWLQGGEIGLSLSINREGVSQPLTPGSYVEVRRDWQAGDVLRLSLPMPVTFVESHPYVAENAGRLAVLRGPLLYSVEAIDNPDVDLRDVTLLPNQEPEVVFSPELLSGLCVLKLPAEVQPLSSEWKGKLYRPYPHQDRSSTPHPYNLTAIPYFAWANRAPGQMRVWIG